MNASCDIIPFEHGEFGKMPGNRTAHTPQLFEHPMFGSLRVIEVEGELFFAANDVCCGLDIKSARQAVERLDEDEKGVYSIYTPGGEQGVWCVTFPGLLSLILGSRKPEAKAYKRWVTHEVLPSIHKTGGYMAAGASETPEETMARALLIAQDALERKDERLRSLQRANDEMRPKALFADSVANSEGLILVRELAHILRQNGVEIGEKRLFRWLRDNGYVEKSRNEPTQRSLDLGVMRVVLGSYTKADGTTMVTRTAKVTGKGQRYFLGKLLSDQAVA